MNLRKNLILLVLPIGLAALLHADITVDKAKKVDQTLKRLAQQKRQSLFLKNITFTQDELNSYLNIFYTKRYAPEVKKIHLDLKAENQVRGSMEINLEGKKYQKVPSFLRDIELQFEGKVECNKYRMRFLFSEIRVNGTKFSPELLDEAFHAAQINYETKKSMYDWFELMPGIKKVEIFPGNITIFY